MEQVRDQRAHAEECRRREVELDKVYARNMMGSIGVKEAMGGGDGAVAASD